MTTTVNTKQVGAYLQMIKALADAVRESGPLGISAGSLYAVCMGAMDLDTFNRMVELLVGSQAVRREAGHRLVWVGEVQRRD